MTFDDWDAYTDATSAMGGGWGAWLCLDCGEDGERDELVDGHCPHCGGAVELS